MFKRIWAVTEKEFIQTLRDRRTLAIQLSLPIVMLLLFGYAITTQVSNIATVVADQSQDGASRAFVQDLESSGYFDQVVAASDEAGAVRAIDEGRAQVGVVIPPDFAARVDRNEAAVQILIDGSDLFVSQSAYNAAIVIAEAHSTRLVLDRLELTGLVGDGNGFLPLQTLVRILYNPDLRDLWFFIPSIIAMLLQVQSVSLTAASVVREREVGTIEQLLVTPIRPAELLIGKTAPNLITSIINMFTILALGMWWFKVPFQGDFALFFALALLYVLSGLGLGLLISTVSQNQHQVQQLNGMVIILGVMLSGFIFPRNTMPALIRLVGNIFPLTHFIPIVRGIMTKGVGFAPLEQQVVALAVYVVVVMVLAVASFRQKLG